MVHSCSESFIGSDASSFIAKKYCFDILMPCVVGCRHTSCTICILSISVSLVLFNSSCHDVLNIIAVFIVLLVEIFETFFYCLNLYVLSVFVL